MQGYEYLNYRICFHNMDLNQPFLLSHRVVEGRTDPTIGRRRQSPRHIRHSINMQTTMTTTLQLSRCTATKTHTSRVPVAVRQVCQALDEVYIRAQEG